MTGSALRALPRLCQVYTQVLWAGLGIQEGSVYPGGPTGGAEGDGWRGTLEKMGCGGAGGATPSPAHT